MGDDEALLGLYDEALPYVYGYLLSRCRERPLAEDLTAETFLAAVDAIRVKGHTRLDTAWLIGVARHKLVDHWRRETRNQLRLRAVHTQQREDALDDPWEARLDRMLAEQTLDRLAPQHRTVLTLRYVDDLPVPEVARVVGRTVQATEALLVRARRAFAKHYPTEEPTEGGTP